MSWKVLITASGFGQTGQHALEILRKAGCRTIVPPKSGPLTASEITALLPEIDAVLASLDDYSEMVLGSPGEWVRDAVAGIQSHAETGS